MRAVFYKFDNHADIKEVIVSGDTAHHLNVVRVKTHDPILLMNGEGRKLTGLITQISKKDVIVQINKSESFSPEHKLALAVAMPKKDAFEDILKMAVELGITEIYPLVSDFSQYEYVFSERVQRVMESALIQSNNPFFPIIHAQQSLKEFLSRNSETLFFFNSQKNETQAFTDAKEAAQTILIGPEGGFSPEEVTQILNYARIQEIHLPTPILRAPTAVAASIGYLLAKYR